jgi:hypothetical protein
MSRPLRASRICVAFALAAVGLGGCAGYDVELQGGLFDLVGLNEIGKRKAEPQMRKRNGLVVPPTTASLPVPGSAAPQPEAVAAFSGQESWPVDPDKSKAQQNAEMVARHKAFCAEARKRHDAGLVAQVENGPLGSCEESILRNFTGKGLFEREAAAPTAQ